MTELTKHEREVREQAALDTLRSMGYTWNGGMRFRPPLGKAPDFDELQRKASAGLLEGVQYRTAGEHEEIFDQLIRYGGSPDHRIMPMLYALQELNDSFKQDLDTSKGIELLIIAACALAPSLAYATGGYTGDAPTPAGVVSPPESMQLFGEEALQAMGEQIAEQVVVGVMRRLNPPTTITINPGSEGLSSGVREQLIAMFGKSNRRATLLPDVPAATFPAPEGDHISRNGFEHAFYEIAKLLDVGAQALSPQEVFEQQMLPQIKQALEAARTPVSPIRWFRMQHGPHIPWEIAEILYAGYASVYGTGQSIERMSERGGFGWGEISSLMKEPGRSKVAQAMRAKARELDIGFSE
jgi:hypothetical protein